MPIPAGVNGTTVSTAETSATKMALAMPIWPAAGFTTKSPSAAATAASRMDSPIQIASEYGRALRTTRPPLPARNEVAALVKPFLIASGIGSA